MSTLVDVTEFPVRDSPIALPSWVTLREGPDGMWGLVGMFSHNGEPQVFHVLLRMECTVENISHALRNLGGARFELEYPGKYGDLLNAEIEAAIGKRVLEPWETVALARRKELTGF